MSEFALSDLLPNERVALEAYTNQIRARFSNRIEAVILFGSKVRGDASVESDIDLVVMVDAETRELRSELWQITSDISLDHYVVISPRVIGRVLWAKMSSQRLPLYRAIKANGVVLTPEPPLM